jgi:hypothetical protein
MALNKFKVLPFKPEVNQVWRSINYGLLYKIVSINEKDETSMLEDENGDRHIQGLGWFDNDNYEIVGYLFEA